MSAPVGNQFWKMRTKHGRDKIFTDPEIMLQACYEYFNYQSQQSWIKQEAVKSGEFTGQLISIPTASPFTLEGLCLYLGVHSKYFIQFQSDLKPKENKTDEDFNNIITHVREVIYLQKLEGAMVGTYNSSIVARQLGLAEITKGEVTGKDGAPINHKMEINVNVVQSGPDPVGSEKDIDLTQ